MINPKRNKFRERVFILQLIVSWQASIEPSFLIFGFQLSLQDRKLFVEINNLVMQDLHTKQIRMDLSPMLERKVHEVLFKVWDKTWGILTACSVSSQEASWKVQLGWAKTMQLGSTNPSEADILSSSPAMVTMKNKMVSFSNKQREVKDASRRVGRQHKRVC